MNERKPASGIRKFFAGLLDVFTIFGFGGYAIASITGNLTDTGFRLQGGPAFLLFALVAAYFFIGRKYLGGTLWQRILSAY